MHETTVHDAIEGIKTVYDAGQNLDLPVLYAGVNPSLVPDVKRVLGEGYPVPIWPLSRYMLLPWEDGFMWSRQTEESN
jgi:hypothetical protein